MALPTETTVLTYLYDTASVFDRGGWCRSVCPNMASNQATTWDLICVVEFIPNLKGRVLRFDRK